MLFWEDGGLGRFLIARVAAGEGRLGSLPVYVKKYKHVVYMYNSWEKILEWKFTDILKSVSQLNDF